MASNHLIKSQYLKYFLVALAMGLLLRFIETAQVYFKFNPKYLLASEGFGVLRDIFITGLILIFTYPLYHSLHRKWPVHGKLLTWFFIGTFVFLHIAISEYFFYQLRPLDIFLFKHRPEEMAFSIQTAGFNVYLPFFLKSIFVLLSYYLLVLYVERKTLPVQWAKPIAVGYAMASIVFLPIYFFVKLPVSSNLSVNKSTFLYSNIVLDWYHSVFGPDRAKLANHYQEHFPDRKYLSGQYPFLHQFEPDDRLGSHLDSLASAPNLVVIIVEGLSDDFIHPIQGIPFMPYLDSLSTKSLYWKHFFATSERSFGATPSINGSLPYANDGFALLHQFPYHFSLANIFKENQFLTSFYYGQGAWFHGKEAFYRFNNIDRIIDKTVFNKQLEKVYVGPDNHFWGYNDMDLFQQYFLSTDSIRERKRYDVFFTGTSHAPFALKHPDRYHKKLDAAIAGLSGLEAREHFEKYRTYYTSLYNVDEAIRYFMESYSNRPDYEQTLFVITGDHPMTEIPVENELKKYQVPLIVYSPLIREPQTFQEFASHLDLYETLLSYYHNQFQLNVPTVS
ncbi:MAG TPA: LTA synthase family protein, partial [Saprospiraceae bacterium]|nr:LTA synthase family protein [Saprospiraceae bacterium]